MMQQAPDTPEPSPGGPTGIAPKTLPAAHGWLWVLHGFALFRAYPAFWCLLLLFYWLLLLLAGSIPAIGAGLATILIPGLSGGFMVACHAAQNKLPPLPAHLFWPFRAAATRNAQWKLGVAYLMGLVAILGASALVDGGALFRIMLVGVKLNDEALQAPGLQAAGLLALMLYTPVMLAFWFAPALCFWHGMGAGKALFFSFFAGLRNTRAFFVYGMGWMLFAGVVPLLAGALLSLVLPGGAQGASLAALIIAPYMIAVVCAMILSFYSSFIDVFGAPPAPAAPAKAG
jgi:hypothetical protein